LNNKSLKSINEHPALPWILLLLLSFIWGSSFILIKKGLEAYSPDQVGTIRVTFAFLLLLPVAVKHLNTVSGSHWKKILTLGLLSNLIPAILFSIAETGLSSSLTGILNSLTPITTMIIGVIAFSTKIKKFQIIGLAVGLTGSIGITIIGEKGSVGTFNHYAIYVIVATICYGIGGNLIKAYLSHINSVILTSLTMIGIGPIALLYLLSTDFFNRLSTVEGAWESLGYIFLLGAVGTALALILFNRLIQLTTAIAASSVTYLIPLVAVMWGIVDGEILFPLHFAGMLLIIIGVYITNRYK
jgi:drug/metabolite transporter (DMT)-like permease